MLSFLRTMKLLRVNWTVAIGATVMMMILFGEPAHAKKAPPGCVSFDLRSLDVLTICSDSRDAGCTEKAVPRAATIVPRGGGGISWMIPAGWHPFGYAISDLGLKFLEFEGSLDCDVGRLLASLKSSRKTEATLKEQWLEIVRVSKTGQSMRIYRTIPELLQFCLQAGFIN
jgi:hypothetical protein